MARRVLPFPLAIHLGTDICHVPRIYALLCGPRGARLIRRVLAPEELERPRRPIADILRADKPSAIEDKAVLAVRADLGAVDPAARQSQLWDAAVFLAGRFAAKEAAIKAHPHRRLTFHDVVIRSGVAGAGLDSGLDCHGQGVEASSGPPSALIRSEVPGGHDQVAAISISHDGDYATAVCMGFEASRV